MEPIAEIAPIMRAESLQRLQDGRTRLGQPEDLDRALLQRRLDLLVDVN